MHAVAMQTACSNTRAPQLGPSAPQLLEAALCLALQQKELDGRQDVIKGGVLTPASGEWPQLPQGRPAAHAAVTKCRGCACLTACTPADPASLPRAAMGLVLV